MHAAVDGQDRAGGRAGKWAGEVADRGGDLVGTDQPTDRLPGFERRPFSTRVVCLRQQPADPWGVGRAGRYGIDANAVADIVGGHRQRQRMHSTLGGGVRSSLREPSPTRDRPGVDDRSVGGALQMGERGTCDADHAEHIHIEHVHSQKCCQSEMHASVLVYIQLSTTIRKSTKHIACFTTALRFNLPSSLTV